MSEKKENWECIQGKLAWPPKPEWKESGSDEHGKGGHVIPWQKQVGNHSCNGDTLHYIQKASPNPRAEESKQGSQQSTEVAQRFHYKKVRQAKEDL